MAENLRRRPGIVQQCETERQMLRTELDQLKKCQVTFLTTAIAATGLLLGLASRLGHFRDEGLVGLLPLIVLLPCWWIFFDKATSITRIVGYYRILETYILGDIDRITFPGWENALAEFRRREHLGALPRASKHNESSGKKVCKLITLKPPHPYWVLVYYTYAGLTLVCFSASAFVSSNVSTRNLGVLVATGLLCLVSALRNGYLVWALIWGRYSYEKREKCWRAVLGVTERGAQG